MFIFAWLAKIGLGGILGELASAYKAKQQAQTDQEKIAADERISALRARRDVMMAEASPINAIMRALFAFPVALYHGKIFVWDKVLGLGKTDPLSPELNQISMIVIGFYFLYEGVRSVRKR